jgi:hypothetical protein
VSEQAEAPTTEYAGQNRHAIKLLSDGEPRSAGGNAGMEPGAARLSG